MKIGEFASQLGVSTDTLRYYEKHALLTPSARTQAGYRDYSQTDLKQMMFILRAKNVGFSLAEIKELLQIKFKKHQHSCHEVKNLTIQKRDLVAERIAELTRFHQSLSVLADKCCGGKEPADNCSILTTLEDIDGLNQ
ncbi:MAG: MerR family Zn(II)-responsive transcriptional regulator of zntA [Pseudoalteromonas rhizosphaerae]|jgi:MerR family Zn(II)-responsive transcriptional regulator of zntA|uniref:Zn(2+)-responsive transcriptional regulator n=1 Tax=Pseudoalteromonas neustonica TaxID=1840331 RepID=A0ABY3FHA0_9GAMM|nr:MULTISPECIES: Zn(2+)-responsive transcriptional regulator [Pseudoalteromonas]MBB1293045.1 Zn(2+)-responsive transcriptional regulator [Pseudoalteromonas sp. SR41-4]MBB1301142.1 Zn(2+)-responsive transcriptional regulator [Pseudoalteromonas sp. SR44-8]MBB1309667.1 Zn(2+)-responsive transcriptional regulator [Pseudoalteromonas sp. SR41-8]MBB1397004.1 Zn(2+)-responsive transcriptional regulator [Pseudoalteromonas sp. SG44-8]MBB1408471.1 Zn(2+)-responsive transcriptional regulator [Pseudoaltero|tara:strand:+ start:467 stop:880 length:414 start_codon:yes stop_codon:yes gene_type:complete|eukprot:GDKH01029027.1.p1 GENE.GDKH01029027.1~~GDKH01029027.1.p1  ORF type:complete len:138 (-),score=6.28 GDKH01029027.1:214-627(-)